METMTASRNLTVATEPEKISKAGQWRRAHPRGLEGVVITDPRILDGLSILDILYAKQNEVLN